MAFDIFASFDPIRNIYGDQIFFWRASFIPLFMMYCVYWCCYRPRYYLFVLVLLRFIGTQRNRTKRISLSIRYRVLVIIFLLLVNINLVGLVPYVFRVRRHLVFSLRLGFPLWLSLILSGVFWRIGPLCARLLPGGAPEWLNPFLVLVETRSHGVRPFTISFRLTANMRAGHIVLTLLGFYLVVCFYFSLKLALILFFFLCLYIVFEIGVSLVQAYIFCLLGSLYIDDHPSLVHPSF